jgi:carboxypeptidase Taq
MVAQEFEGSAESDYARGGRRRMTDHLQQLRGHLAELADLRNATAVLGWDQQTMMPPRGGPSRAETLATVQKISHDRFISAETGRLLDAAAEQLDGDADESDEARLVSVTRRHWEKSRRVPSDLAADLARAASIGQEAWVKARQDSDFAGFAPYLKRNLELTRRYAECFEGFDTLYDALLDDYDPGLQSAQVTPLFDELKRELAPMVATLSEKHLDDSCLHGSFPREGQHQLVTKVLTMMGFDPESWRMDDSVHPFSTSMGSDDIRITTRWDESYFPSALYSAMHETGHGLYEAGIKVTLQRTPLGTGESLSIHESQSRMWENMVGRGRPFADALTPLLRQHLDVEIDPDSFYRAVNCVEPSFIRVEADEATYSLHIVVRYELEQELIAGRLEVDDLPAAWNARFQDYFGLEVPDDAQGVLQDVHWSAGLIGYFPTYALGNLVAGQLWERVNSDIPDLSEQIAGGELSPLREWLREHVHQHGAKFSSREMLQRVVGEEMVVGPFVGYLKAKLGAAYDTEL